MLDRDEAAKAAILARLNESRAELRRVLDPPRQEPGEPLGAAPRGSGFPRSRIMRTLMTGRGLGMLGAAAAGLFIARPTLVLQLLRMLPAGATARMLLLRAFVALREKSARPRPGSGPSA